MGTIVIGIAGGSGSGKTTLARALESELGPRRAEVLAQDHYYIDQSRRFDGDGGSVNFDHPSAIDLGLLAKHLVELKRGNGIDVPIYDFATHTRLEETTRFESREVVIVEGTLIFAHDQLQREIMHRVFVDAPEGVRFSRRLHRDTVERGREPEGVKRQFERQVKPMHDQFVEPSRSCAHLIISGTEGIDLGVKRVLQEILLRQKC